MFALPTAEADLIRHWTLDGVDLAAVDRRRGGHNQLGYALQLCTFRYPGRLLRPGEAIPEPALRFVAEQIYVGADALTERWCTSGTEHVVTPAPSRYVATRIRRTESGRPAASIWFRTATPMAASVCWAAKPRARKRGPISAL